MAYLLIPLAGPLIFIAAGLYVGALTWAITKASNALDARYDRHPVRTPAKPPLSLTASLKPPSHYAHP